jgi:hypothetical protein
MILPRWIALLVLGGALVWDAVGQESTESSQPVTPAESTTPTEPTTSGAASSFGATPVPTDRTGGLGATGGGEPGAGGTSSGQGVGFGTPKAPSSAPSFTLPGFYGSSATTYTAGQGRLARPRFRYRAELAVGYDDNALQTPSQLSPEQRLQISLPTPPTLEPIIENRIRIGQGGVVQVVPVVVGFREVKGKPAKFQTIAPQKRTGSIFSRGSFGLDIQLFSPRSLFTFDLNGNVDHYLNRPGLDQTEYNAGVALSYLYRITPRMQTTAQFSAAYLTQPDYSRINTPDVANVGAYINANVKLDLTYRWTPRFTSVLSLSDNALIYEAKTQEGNNYNDTVFGTELRYLWSPRFTALAEVRHSTIKYTTSSVLNSQTLFLLLGSEFKLTQRLAASVRVGESFRTFEQGGDTATTPYMETSLGYRLTQGTVVNWSMRFGFEEPFAAGVERIVFRTGLSLAQVFTARLNGVASLNLLHETNTFEGTQTESTSDIFDATVRLEYAISKRFSVNATYTYTKRGTSEGFIDYDRNRFFIGAQYSF